MDEIMSLCKRRGFIYQASEIYGGINGFWDYGPLGAQLKKNLRDAWWQDIVMNPCWGRKGPDGERVSTVPLDTTIIQHPKVWEASGHVAGFNDPMVDCKECKSRFRADHVVSGPLLPFAGPIPDHNTHHAGRFWMQFLDTKPAAKLWWVVGDKPDTVIEHARAVLKARKVKLHVVHCAPEHEGDPRELFFLEADGKIFFWPAAMKQERLSGEARCPRCGGALTEPRQFNLMFRTYIGATATEDDKAFLRPETAQGIFVQFKNVVDTTRVRVPFGIAQTGKAFRNEVTPRNFTFRSREFEQMEIEFFCHEDQAMEWYRFWRDWRMEWWKSLGLAGANLILREHEKDELAHYSKATSDIEYRFPFTAPGFGELEGIAYRGNYDLTQHMAHSRAKIEYNDTERGELLPNGQRRGEKYLPHVIEPSAGLDRGVLAVLCEAYTKDASRPSPEIMRFHPRLAPIKAAVYPLVNKDGMPEVAERLFDELRARFGRQGFIETDAKQSIGKRYARMDEAGCPFCFTVDGDTLTNQTVTVRDRDTGSQERIAIDKVSGFLDERLGG
jgi:glycyl-tRNA synthetase